MGLLSSIFGGGSKVTTTTNTEVTTQVDVALSNIIDLSGLEGIFQQLKDFIISDADRDAEFKTLLAQEGAEENELNKQQQTLLLLNTVVEAERNQQFAQANKTFKNLALGACAIAVFYLFMRKK